MYKYIAYVCLITALLSSAGATGRSLQGDWREETNVYEHVYDAALRTTGHGSTSLLLLAQEKPLILVLIFTRCSGVCSPLLLQLKEDLRFGSARDDFSIVVLSFDPRDQLSDMHSLSRGFNLGNDRQWVFAITDSIGALNRSIGFKPVWDERRGQYDHDALLVGINREGLITKKLLGVRNGNELAALISSIHNNFSPTYRLPGKSMLFSCFNYDPVTGRNTPGTGLLFIALPGVLTLILLVTISCLVHKN